MSLDFVGASSRPFRLYCILVTVQTGLQLIHVLAFLGCFFWGRLQHVEPDGFPDLQDFLGHLLDLCISYGLLIFSGGGGVNASSKGGNLRDRVL